MTTSPVTVTLNVTAACAAILQLPNASAIVESALATYRANRSQFLRGQVRARLDKLSDVQVAGVLAAMPVVTSTGTN